MDGLEDHRPITSPSIRWNANSLVSGGLLVLLVLGYIALIYLPTIAVGMLLFGGTVETVGERWLWAAGVPWWFTGLAVAAVAVTISPVSRWLHHRVADLVYGQHDNPYAVLSQLSQHLHGVAAPDALLPTVAATLAATLNLPYVAIKTEGGAERMAATYGAPPPRAEIISIPLTYRTTTLGTLHASARHPHERLSAGDTRLLADLARQVGITLHAAQVTEALQASREQLILAREEERRRIRRDLHDGLGPTLAYLRLQLSALRHTVRQEPAAVEPLIDELRDHVRAATAEIRRLVYDLRPPMLDEFGLVGALGNLPVPGDGLAYRVDVPEPLPPLPAAVEVALYRIAAEALHNVARHARATHCTISLAFDNAALTLAVTDNGCGLPAHYHAGVGHLAMVERAAELGGTVTILPAPVSGTCVTATFPLKVVPDA